MRWHWVYILLFSNLVWAQEPSQENIEAVNYKDFSLGLNFNTRGWGFAFDFGVQKNYKYKHLFSVLFSNIRHDKEYKIYSGGNVTRGYYFGKLNSLVALRPIYGGKLRLFEAKRENGIEISFKWGVGPSIGFLKPVWLKIDNPNATMLEDEKYDPTKHSSVNISARSNYFKGFSDGVIRPGVFTRASLDFNFSAIQKAISGGEIGIMADYFSPSIVLLHQNPGTNLFLSFYLQFNIGQRIF